MDCCSCCGPVVFVLPINIAIAHLGSHAPLVHHFRPFTTYCVPFVLFVMELSMFVASEDATAGSVIAKHDRISPIKSGNNHLSCCSFVP